MVALSPVPDFSASPIAELMAYVDASTPPPVDSWHPERRGSIDMRISADGQWYHEGAPIRRAAMVRLFSQILRREADGSHVLVTPAECLTITVDDAPFVATLVRNETVRAQPCLLFQLNTGDMVVAGPEHPLRLRDGPAGRLPYLHVRGPFDRPIEARLARPVYYALAEQADAQGRVASGGSLWPVGEVE